MSLQKRRKPHAPSGTCSFRNDQLASKIGPENSPPIIKRQPSRGATALKQSLIESYSFDRISAADCMQLIRAFDLVAA